MQVLLSAAHYPNWSVNLFLQPGTTLEYKFIRKGSDGTVSGLETGFILFFTSIALQVVWESGPNRELTVALSGSQNASTSWR